MNASLDAPEVFPVEWMGARSLHGFVFVYSYCGRGKGQGVGKGVVVVFIVDGRVM